MLINLILAVYFIFAPTGSWDLFAIKSAAVHGLVLFQVNGHDNIIICIIGCVVLLGSVNIKQVMKRYSFLSQAVYMLLLWT